MKKVAICTLNSKYVHASLAPWCLLAGMKEYCTLPVETCVLEGTVNQPVEDMVERICQGNYDFVGFSCYIWNIVQTERVISLIKEKLPTLPIVLGGPEVSFNQREVLTRCHAVDFVLSGEGERNFPALVECFFGGGDFSSVDGLSYGKEGEIVVNPPCFPKEEPPSPYCEEYFRQLQGKISYMESSRGCPFSCAFCLSGQGQCVRYFSLPRVKEEILRLANSGTQTVKFIDRTFNSNVTHANAILEFILEHYGTKIPTSVCFHFELAGDILKESTLELLGKMPDGYVQLEIGMQSFCEETLKAVGRTTNISLLVENIKKLVALKNHHLHIDLIAGLPLEDLKEFKNSFNTGYLLGADMLQLGFLKVLQGSKIGENPTEFPCEYSKKPPYQVISTPWMSEEDFALLDGIEDCVDRLYNSGRFTRTLDYLLEKTTLSPFDLYAQISQALPEEKISSLDGFVDEIYRICGKLPEVSTEVLRDKLMLDRVETNSTGNIPKSLMIQDPNLRKLKVALEKNPQTACPDHGKRFVGILYSEKLGVYVDYPLKSTKGQHFSQRFVSQFVSLDILDEIE